jgi:hypothetical protein
MKNVKCPEGMLGAQNIKCKYMLKILTVENIWRYDEGRN